MVLLAVLLLSGGLAWAVEQGDGEAHGAGWAATDTYRVINFTVLVVALFLLLRKPASNAMNARIESIRKQLDELEAKKLAAEKEMAAYSERLKGLEAEAESIIGEYVKQGEKAREMILAEARKSADKLQEQAKRHMEYELKDAREKLRDEILEKAVAMGEELIRKSISDEDQNRLADEYVEKVVSK